jgi:hypothetical protein
MSVNSDHRSRVLSADSAALARRAAKESACLGDGRRHFGAAPQLRETGRSSPSRDMVVTLARTLDVPLRERNALLVAAGYAPQYHGGAIGRTELAPVRRALDFILRQQEPFPAVVMDRHWNLSRFQRGRHAVLRAFHRPRGRALPSLTS